MPKCTNKKNKFPACQKRKIEVQFVKKEVTSDGGVLLLREIDSKLKLTQRLSSVIPDQRDQGRITHSMKSMLKQRIYSIALGYEDLNDQNALRKDLALQTAVDRIDTLASSPTLCRLENTANKKVAVDIHKVIIDIFIESFASIPEEIILDFDATEDKVHGHQENRHFHGYYKSHCFLPLHVFCGDQLLISYLRPSNIDGAKHSWAILALLVKRIRLSWPKVKIIFRGDSGFCRDKMLRWCERNNVKFIIGIAQNKRLNETANTLQVHAKNEYKKTEIKQRVFGEVSYAAKSWKGERRIIVKAEYTNKGANTRYVVTNEKSYTAKEIYADKYCARGDMENRIKEMKYGVFSDRTSCHKWWPNQLRLLFSSAAYILIESIRRLALKNTELATAQCSTIRLKLYKIGAIILRNTRKIKFLLSNSYPKQKLFFEVADKLSCIT